MPTDILFVTGKAAEHAKRAGIGIDDPGADPAVFRQAELGSRLRRQRTNVGADRTGPLRQIAVLKKVIKADDFEEIALPCTFLMRQIGPFRRQRALRAGQRAGRLPGQEIGEVE